MITINNNLSALNVAHTLSGHYGRLQTSTERLSSGLRINGAADDAAGLAIRELMRADIAALNQGVRNANDAISMLQTFDGALGVIDEKLIRMKELAEQAATGTYDSTQRLMIDSEFQAMGSEINRIANATDFNGIKLLCTPMKTWFTEENKFVVTDPGSVSGLQLPAGKNGNPVLSGINPARYVDENTPTKTISVSLTAVEGTKEITGSLEKISDDNNGNVEYKLAKSPYTAALVGAIGDAANPVFTYDGKNWSVVDAGNHNYEIINTGNRVPGDPSQGNQKVFVCTNPLSTISFALNDENGPVNVDAMDPDIVGLEVDTIANTYTLTTKTAKINADTPDYTASYNADNQTVTVNLKSGGTTTLKLDNALAAGDAISFDIKFAGEVKPVQVEHHEPDPDMKLTIHFGTMNDSAEDYYHINYENCTLEGLGIEDVDVKTQDNAQNALVDIKEAIVKKDKVRAKFGAMQNRLENTATNLRTQAENLQTAESRISDAQIATEMMEFVRNQILSNSAVAMLAQANSMPQMVMALIH